jgi:hypothetical protein
MAKRVYLTSGVAARRLGVSGQMVRVFVGQGKLRVAGVAGEDMNDGIWLFDPAEVERLRRAREEARNT